MNEKKPRLGELLLETGVLQKDQLDKALALQKKRQLRLGTVLLQEAFVSEPQLVQALSRRLSIPWVNLWHIDIEDELLDLVPASVAEEFFLIPIYIRVTGNGERALYVAMNDPTDDSALRFVAAASGMSVKPMIAAPSDISAAIRAYYYGEEEPSLAPGPPPIGPNQQGRGTAVPPPPVAVTSKPNVNKPPLPPPPGQVQENAQPPLESPQLGPQQDEEASPPSVTPPKTPDNEASTLQTAESTQEPPPKPPENQVEAELGEVEETEKRVSAPPQIPEAAKGATGDKSKAQREVEKHMFGVGASKGKGISLTLLDGTTIDFGGASKQPEAPQKELDQDAFIAALLNAASGSTMDSRMPSDNWHHYFTALLQILFKKHLVFFNEFVKEVKELKEKDGS